MPPDLLKWIIVVLSLLNAGYMALDGARALIKGDYIRPKSGEYAGRLGPWAGLMRRAGIDPMSSLMKSLFVFWGFTGLVITACFALNLSWAWAALLIYNICSTWYLVMGTISSGLQILLLLVMHGLK